MSVFYMQLCAKKEKNVERYGGSHRDYKSYNPCWRHQGIGKVLSVISVLTEASEIHILLHEWTVYVEGLANHIMWVIKKPATRFQ